MIDKTQYEVLIQQYKTQYDALIQQYMDKYEVSYSAAEHLIAIDEITGHFNISMS